ncbi:hypothetical protein OG689_17600 [Kitasatospora sp. NBC_00240]|uniref:hypothetical protein n=1 Tax=Kitasatospora sp. NBC_00240 TaxID=2903567 RepID=UPI0022561FC1|nr:hypothetical protein [Kitasatospora sp. NBC_00240]MCX5211083.1 hypothetical protein [Kitasatospora sp. NBC_00240]
MNRLATFRRAVAPAARALPAAVAGLGVLLLCSCGGPVQAGAAAVLDGERISLTAVQERVAELRTVTAASPGDAEAGAEGLARRAVTQLVLDALVSRALADRGLSVGAGEAAAARAADQAWAGGAAQLEQLLAARGVPATEVDRYYLQQVGIRRLAAARGQDAGTEAGDTEVRRALAEAADALHVRVNPRYGSWDAQRVVLTPDRPDS